MIRQIFRDSKPSTQLFFSAFVLIICGLVVTLLGMGLARVIYGVNLSDIARMMQDLSNPENISILKFFQTIQSIGIFLIPPFIIAWMLHGNPSVYLQVNKAPTFQSALIVVAIIFFSNPLINWLNEINAKLTLPEWLNSVQIWMQNSENQANKLTEAFLSTKLLSTLLLNILMIGILPAIGEELVFRGVVQRLFKKMYGNVHVAIWISAALFSALHLQFFGFLPRLVLGAMFGYMLEWSGTLWLPMIAHFVNNTSAVIIFYLVKNGNMENALDKTGTWADGSFYLVIVSLLFLFVLFKALYLRRAATLATID